MPLADWVSSRTSSGVEAFQPSTTMWLFMATGVKPRSSFRI